jgi:hypothetical protein
MKKRLVALTLFAVIASIGLSATADVLYQGSYRCDTWHRRYADGTKYRYSDHNTPSNNDVKNGDVTIKLPASSPQHPRYGVIAGDSWIEALGGSEYGSHGYPYASPATGEGGTVQGAVKPQAGQDLNFSVSSYSLDDTAERGTWHDTYTSACVSYNGTSYSVGKTPNETRAYNATTKTGCDTSHQTSTNNCWAGPTGHCDATGVFCDQGVVLPTRMIPGAVAVNSPPKLPPTQPRPPRYTVPRS